MSIHNYYYIISHFFDKYATLLKQNQCTDTAKYAARWLDPVHSHLLQKEKKNLQDLAGVYVYNVGDRDPLDRPTAKLIKDFSCIEGDTTI